MVNQQSEVNKKPPSGTITPIEGNSFIGGLKYTVREISMGVLFGEHSRWGPDVDDAADMDAFEGTIGELGQAAVFLIGMRKNIVEESAEYLSKNITKSIDPSNIRFSQTSVNGADELTQSMLKNGWKGDPIDVVRMGDGGLTTIDNTRVLAASRAGVDVQAIVRNASDRLPANMVERFTTKKGVPSTWGEAIQLRIGKQNAKYRNTYPQGSQVTGSQ